MMLCSPFYVFKNNFQRQTKDNGYIEVKFGGPCKMFSLKCCIHVPYVEDFYHLTYRDKI